MKGELGVKIAEKLANLLRTADKYCRVYIDGRLIWGSCLPFYGGHFEMRYNTDKVLKVGHFSVYNAGIVQPGEKRRSRLKLP